MEKKIKVCMFVYNNFKHDTRIIKEAQSLIASGYEVTVIALADEDLPFQEDKNGIKVIRVLKDPLNYRLLRFIYNFNPISIIKKTILRHFYPQNKKTSRDHVSHWLKFSFFGVAIRKELANLRIKGFTNYRKEKTLLFSLILYSLLLVYNSLILIYKFIHRSIKALKKGFYWGIKRPIKILVKRYIYQFVRKILASIHRPLCFLDFHQRSLQAISDNRADIYHAHDLNVLAAAYQASKKHSSKLVYDSHEFYVERNREYPHSFISKFLVQQFEKFLIKKCDAVITVSESIAEELSKRYNILIPTVILNTPPLVQRKNKIDSNKSIRSELNISKNTHIVLYLGSITFNRGIEKIIESLTHLPDCCLVLMGYGREKYIQTLKDTAKKFNVTSQIFTFGPVPSEDVTAYAASADLGIAAIQNACLSYYYCLPNKLFEYVFSNLPVVASDFPEMKKIIDSHQIGRTFNPDKPEEIAKAIKEVVMNQTNIEQMKCNTLQVIEKYNWEKESEKLVNLYQSLN